MNILPTIKMNGKEYTIDLRLNQIRRSWTDKKGNRHIQFIETSTPKGRKIMKVYMMKERVHS